MFGNFLQNLASKMIFLYGEFYMILKLKAFRNWRAFEFFQLLTIKFLKITD